MNDVSSTEPAEVRRHLCRTRFGHMHVRESGSGGVPLVLLHYTPYSSLAFEPVMERLARSRRTLAVDRIGFGMSDPAPRVLTMAEYARATLDALATLGVEHFDLAGIHTGAVESLEIATAHEQAVRRLALVAMPVWSDKEAAGLEGFMGSFLQDPQADGSHLVAMWRSAKAMGEGHYPLGQPAGVDAERPDGWPLELVNGFVLHYLLAGPRWYWIYPAIAGFPAAERLPEVRQPLLYVRTLDDIWEQTGRAVALLPEHARLLTLTHLDMAAFTMAPDEMAGVLDRFLTED